MIDRDGYLVARGWRVVAYSESDEPLWVDAEAIGARHRMMRLAVAGDEAEQIQLVRDIAVLEYVERRRKEMGR